MVFIDTYKQYKKITGETGREKLRAITLDGLSAWGSLFGNWEILLKKPRVQFLYIHHIFKDEEAAFDKLLATLSLHHTFISHSDAVHKVLSGNIDKPYISISSDDGLKNNVNAAKILNRYHAKACFFICPAIIAETDENTIVTFAKEKLHFPPVEFMNWNDVDVLLKDGHEIGGHTMTHVNLASAKESQLSWEINQCYEEIKEHCGMANHFAFPYGRFFHFSGEAKKRVFETGFLSCISAERGCHISDGNPLDDYKKLLFRRDHIVLSWPINHIMYFLTVNAGRANINNNYFEYK